MTSLKFDPHPSTLIMLKWPYYLQGYTQCHKSTYPSFPYLRDVINDCPLIYILSALIWVFLYVFLSNSKILYFVFLFYFWGLFFLSFNVWQNVMWFFFLPQLFLWTDSIVMSTSGESQCDQKSWEVRKNFYIKKEKSFLLLTDKQNEEGMTCE